MLVCAAWERGRAGAVDHPSREITLVLPFGSGGIADITSRVVADASARSLARTSSS